MTTDPERLTNLAMELRRGLLVLAVVGGLARTHYGYFRRRYMGERGLEEDEGMLYPLRRRLETQVLLIGKWEEQEGRRRRVYQLSAEGASARAAMTLEWQNLNHAMHL